MDPKAGNAVQKLSQRAEQRPARKGFDGKKKLKKHNYKKERNI